MLYSAGALEGIGHFGEDSTTESQAPEGTRAASHSRSPPAGLRTLTPSPRLAGSVGLKHLHPQITSILV